MKTFERLPNENDETIPGYIIECIDEISIRYSNSIAIIEEETNRRITYHELMIKVSSITAELKKHI